MFWVNTASAAAWQCCPISSWGCRGSCAPQGCHHRLLCCHKVHQGSAPRDTQLTRCSDWKTNTPMWATAPTHQTGKQNHQGAEVQPEQSPELFLQCKRQQHLQRCSWRWVTHLSAGICHVKSNAPQDHTQ